MKDYLEKNKNAKEQEFINNLVILGKKVSVEAATNKELDDKIKKMSSY